MEFMEWALDVAVHHPALSRAIVSPNDEWLDVLLEDGRTFRFRPAALLDPNAPEPERRERLEKLLAIGARNAVVPKIDRTKATDAGPAAEAHSHPVVALNAEGEEREGATDDNGDPLVLPIVRRADYFLASHDRDSNDSIAYLPLTDFIGIGLAEDHADLIQPLFYSQLEERGTFNRAHDDNLGTLFHRAVDNLRHLNLNSGKNGVELAVTTVAGARVHTFTSPTDYQSSWFGDLDIIQQVADSLANQYPGNLPLFVPASRTNLFIVFADDPHLADFFSLLRGRADAKDSLYPLPHTVSSDGWREWIPFADHPTAALLEELRTSYRSRIYDAQVSNMKRQLGQDALLKDYTVRHMQGGRHISIALWRDTDGAGSIPLTDFISFVHQPVEPWDSGSFLNIRARVARDIWSEGMRKMEDVWPPRWEVRGFPDDATLQRLREASHRRI